VKIVNFKSENPITEFAPSWNWVLCEDEQLSGSELVKNLKQIILLNEKKIISDNKDLYNLYNETYNIKFDGGTGLGENSLTSRSPFFNIMNWDYPEIIDLKNHIRSVYDKFLQELKISDRKVWIQSWANVMRSGESINKHIHASHPLTWLGGHLTIACENTSTFYTNPMFTQDGPQVYESVNKEGKLTIFQNNLPHHTNTHLGSKERISIAFDIIPDERYQQLSESRKQIYVEF
jgi:hypothetical protein